MTTPVSTLDPPPVPPGAIHVVGAAIVSAGRCLVAQRSAAMDEALKWEFPGGKVELGEAPREALAREIEEELGLAVEVQGFLARGEGWSRGRQLVLDVFLAHPTTGELRPVEHQAHGWFDARELAELDWAAADLPAVAALSRLLPGGPPDGQTGLGGGGASPYDAQGR
ncbi:MAG: (deoxy)nucleoside triphosphate pyrophosphohydrolase [Acidobacteria bacterium]|nr:(deoxy)nucleoside triphosphate pyrophosphohydrolase [Acidobacteriota bacterium]